MQQGFVHLERIETLVLDEADRMLDMGFIPDIRRIVARLPQRRQTLLFSATMPADIRRLAGSILREPVFIEANPVASTVPTVMQSVYLVPNGHKAALLRHLLLTQPMSRTLVFTRTKHRADKVVRELTRAGIRAQAIHGNKSQNARTRALASFKSHAPPVLVATDIASRGIDVDDITHVVNYDMPNVAETYVHRIGRTARAGGSGTALSFCDDQERDDLRAIERLTGLRIHVRPPPALDLVPPPPPANGHGEQRGREQHRRAQHQRTADRGPDRGMERRPPRGVQQLGRAPRRGGIRRSAPGR
jgi:ATP-dependent RNA helicase RhlE